MDIALAVENGMKKYNKYYTFMDEIDTYYTALVLDPRVKGDLIRQELSEDDDAGRLILEAIRLELHREYNITDVDSPQTEQLYWITWNIATRSFGCCESSSLQANPLGPT
ncbi:hypothetical protein V1508DRAFT_440228 [Lipomyces doorenjongii]|uniref:uncharacterized protein n=1 Tax=Lipomyces doorenjongii TaxID=383834 RepID=UPI0034CDFFA8